jgi:hypothetical protein
MMPMMDPSMQFTPEQLAFFQQQQYLFMMSQ